ncbi:TPA: hypothetical protein ACNV18_000184 [Pseudomonas putida]|uniref:Uncharacterized protein n=5 Tax=Pseudomonas TaxID=286 RepID=A0A2A3M1M8_PSEDL|nr:MULTISPECIES: hypothetical protein [Pseudomonas]AGZ38278.1 hypothetical protein PVLB_27707 [Pseudomonas sp. VLB120]TXG99528.1 MAG: hypothetical protein E6R08_01650 [Nevskiaceae bacterium]MBA6063021.1 hypothetical protein [Pseudomonas juntendi]MCE0945605.1 hypothetical protein [Pseudomonas asiatica]MCE1066645.1 hypothetical protein [Pseudomonas asiatica]
MAAKSTPLAVKVAIYQRLLSGDIARDVGRMYVISMPTVLKYANDAVAELRLLEAVESSPILVGFLSRTVKIQCYQYVDDEVVRDLMAPILEPYLGQAEKINFASRESADQPLSTRVSRTTEEDFQAIVAEMSQSSHPGLTSSALLRDIVEDYIARYKANGRPLPPTLVHQSQTPAPVEPAAPALDGKALMKDLQCALREQLQKHGIELPQGDD